MYIRKTEENFEHRGHGRNVKWITSLPYLCIFYRTRNAYFKVNIIFKEKICFQFLHFCSMFFSPTVHLRTCHLPKKLLYPERSAPMCLSRNPPPTSNSGCIKNECQSNETFIHTDAKVEAIHCLRKAVYATMQSATDSTGAQPHNRRQGRKAQPYANML